MLVMGLAAVYLLALALAVPAFGTAPLTTARPPVLLAILATAAVTAAVGPLHRRCVHLARRLMRTGTASRYDSLAEFGRRLAALSGTDEALAEVAAIVAAALGARRADIWLPAGTEWFPAASCSQVGVPPPRRPPDADVHVELRYGADVLGALSVTTLDGAALLPAQVGLLDDLAGQAAVVLRTVGLTAQLRGRLADISRQRDEYQSARRRILTAADVEQRRFEQELAEGPIAELAVIAAGVRALADEPARMTGGLPELRRHADAAIAKLRDLARGVYPPVLRDSGLGAALHARYRHSGAPVTVHADEGRLPAATELSAYLAGCDAVAAALRRGASSVEVTMGCTSRTMRLTISDNGGPPEGAGRDDLQAAGDRVIAAGGAFRLVAAARRDGAETAVEITLPVPAEDPPA
jgi:signal transduction histidine kinase